MKIDTYITEHLTDEDCKLPLLADIGWLRSLYKQLVAAHKETNSATLYAAIGEVEKMIYKSAETPAGSLWRGNVMHKETRKMHSKVDAHYYMLRKEPTDKVSFFVSTHAPLTEDQKHQLIAAGYTIHSEVGTILTGEAEFGKVEYICDLDFVKSVEMAKRLYPN